VPEGDTIFRTASTMRRWLVGRQVTAARTTTTAAVQRLVGQTVEEVEARAKHLLVRCTGDVTLHTHMKMTGEWHVYSAGDRWQRPAGQARVVVECGERIAVGFNVPVVEVMDRRAEHLHPSIGGLGPDVLQPPVDVDDVRRRAATRPRHLPVADLLLDQGVVSGIGNIWRSEALFAARVDPYLAIGGLTDGALERLVRTAAELMTRAATAPRGAGPRPRHAVYGRARRPCVRCGTPIRSAPFANGRTVYWCPTCQAREASQAGQP
jgi:endonuclease-8